MKKLLFILLILTTWYLASMYRTDALMTAAVMELLIFLGMPVCVRYMKKKMEICFRQSYMKVSREEYVGCPLQVNYKGMLPVSRFQIRLSYGYDGEASRKNVVFSGNIDKRKQDRAGIRIPTPWNGKITVRIERVNIYDYFSLFQTQMVCGEEMLIAVLPSGDRAVFKEVSTVQPESVQNEILRKGNYGEEFQQLREYMQGDSYRHIHWKQSARTGILWVKEYQETEKKSVCVYLDFRSSLQKSIQALSVFFEILWLLLSDFLEQGFILQLCWEDHAGERISRQAREKTEVAELFAEWYEKDWPEKKQGIKEIKAEGAFRFGPDLRLFFSGKELICFTQEHYKKELEEMGIVV